MTTDDLLKQGIAALNEGRKTEAHKLLTEVVKHDERNEMAWLWLSGAVNTDEDRRVCLENVLAINPNNGLAQRGLATLQKPGSPRSGHTSNVTPLGGQARLQSVGESRTIATFQPVREETATNEILQQAIAAIKSGEKERGRQLLVKALEQDEDNEAAWLWMTRCATDRDVKRECFERVLEINPNNEFAKKGLRQLDTLSKAKSSPTAVRHTKKPNEKSRTNLVLVLFVLIAISCCVFMAVNSTQSSDPESGGSTMAYIMCQNFIEDRLVAPTTAKWPHVSEIEVARFSDREDEAYRVTGYVDAQNRMGAMIRTYYVCEITYLGSDQWRLEYLDIIE